jgi:hypothetical protein
MSIGGRWRVVETPGYDMAVAGAYILFDEDGDKLRFVWPSLLIHAVVAEGESDSKPDGLGFVPWDHILRASLCVGVCDMSLRPRDLADRMAGRGQPDGFVRETFLLPREQVRAKAKAFLRSNPKAAYMSEVERCRELPDGAIEFIMRRLRTAD